MYSYQYLIPSNGFWVDVTSEYDGGSSVTSYDLISLDWIWISAKLLFIGSIVEMLFEFLLSKRFLILLLDALVFLPIVLILKNKLLI